MSQRFFVVFITCSVLVLSLSFFLLPSLGSRVFLSPDETANAVAGNMFAASGSFRLPVSSSIANPYPWLHPRSFVYRLIPETGASFLVPVGFLGMPLLSGFLQRMVGLWGLVLFTPVLALSVLYPLYSFAQRFGRTGRWAVLVGWVTFPTVILYANRGLFPNLVVVCLAIWAAWLVWRTSSVWRYAFAGILLAGIVLIRPIEMIWILPWIVACFFDHHAWEKKRLPQVLFLVVPFLVGITLLGWLNRETYGFSFVFGYQLRDPVLPSLTPTMGDVAHIVPSRSWYQSWPFGFHPRNMWFNVKSYLLVYLFPWFVLTCGALMIVWKRREWRKWLMLAGYSTVVLISIYGQGLYQDHVRVNQVSLGNSFLRYLLPLALVATFSFAVCIEWMENRWQKIGKPVAACMLVFVAMVGIWTAVFRDDEGVWKNRQELQRYATIREQASAQLTSSDSLGSSDEYVVLSERSDKIFFPVFLAASPLPSRSEIYRLLTDDVVRKNGIIESMPVVLFLHTLSSVEISAWKKDGIILEHLFQDGNESLYRATLAVSIRP